MNIYKNSLRKLKLLEAFRNMFFMFDAYISIEHCEVRECMRRYIQNGDSIAPILEDAEERMNVDKRKAFYQAMQDSLDSFASQNKGLVEKRDAELVVHTCRELGGMRRGFISEVLGKAGSLLEKRIVECRERDVKNGKLMNQLGIIIGIAIVILII